jgi:hypothetical protein
MPSQDTLGITKDLASLIEARGLLDLEEIVQWIISRERSIELPSVAVIYSSLACSIERLSSCLNMSSSNSALIK